MNDIIEEMQEEYLADCERRLAEIRAILWAPDFPSAAGLADVERHAHAVKGSARTFGLPEVSLLCGAWEGDMKAARKAENASGPLTAWRRYTAMFAALIGQSAALEEASGPTHILIWAPFEADRRRLVAGLDGDRGHPLEIARTDRAALSFIAHNAVSLIVGDTETDSELAPDRRARLVAAAAQAAGASSRCENMARSSR